MERSEITVYVIDRGRKNLYMRYSDPVTGKQEARSTGTHRKRDAERVAAKWEAELREGRYKPPSKTTWDEFRDRITVEYAPTMAERSAEKVESVLDSYADLIKPKLLSSATTASVVRWQTHLRNKELAEATIKTYSATIKAAFRWAERVGLMSESPSVEMPKRGRRSDRSTPMKGRAITEAEFRKVLKKVVAVVGEEAAPSWSRLLDGLWLSGLRLSEALSLSWDDEDELRVITQKNHVMLAIPGERQKSNREQLLPIVPEFEAFLRKTPKRERTGFVFNPVWQRRHSRGGRRLDSVSSQIAEMGKLSGVVVSNKRQKPKYASAHDLRRSFGDRWAARVPSLTLKTLMRHESIETTERYYVTRNAIAVMDELRGFKDGMCPTCGAKLGDTLGDT